MSFAALHNESDSDYILRAAHNQAGGRRRPTMTAYSKIELLDPRVEPVMQPQELAAWRAFRGARKTLSRRNALRLQPVTQPLFHAWNATVA